MRLLCGSDAVDKLIENDFALNIFFKRKAISIIASRNIGKQFKYI